MNRSFLEYARGYLLESQDVLGLAAQSEPFLSQMGAISTAIAKAFRAGGKVMLAGNGGSAADAQHIAGEFLSRLNFDRAPLAAIALTVDTSVLTAIGNDYGYEQVFERQVHGLGRPGDVFIGISTSGRSPNILRALRKAREIGVTTIGFCGGRRTEMWDLCDIVMSAPSESTPLIQQVHITAAHIICGEVERELFKPDMPASAPSTEKLATV
jgi:D-sedoheptulose 7-phosphate isomerase